MNKIDLQQLVDSQMNHKLLRQLLKAPAGGNVVFSLPNGAGDISLRVTTASQHPITAPAQPVRSK